jgi:hypothetical protein
VLDVKCPQCQILYHSDERNVGRSLRCTACRVAVPIVGMTDSISQLPPRTMPRPVGGTHKAATGQLALVGALVALLAIAAAVSALWQRRPNIPLSFRAANVPSVGTVEPPAEITNQPSSASTGPVLIREEPRVEAKSVVNWKVVGEESPVRMHAADEEASPSHAFDARPKVYNSPPSGTLMDSADCVGGHGVLRVENGTTKDAVVKLYDPRDERIICQFFVRRNESAGVPLVPEGDYDLKFAMGLDLYRAESGWDFRWQPSYCKYDSDFRYTEQRDDDVVHYHEMTVTLQPVLAGNVKATPISREEFLGGHGNAALVR